MTLEGLESGRFEMESSRTLFFTRCKERSHFPDPPSRYHLSFDRLMTQSKPKGCVAFDRSARSTLRLSTGLRRIFHTPQASLLGAPADSGIFDLQTDSDTLLMPRDSPKALTFHTATEFDGGFRQLRPACRGGPWPPRDSA